MLNQPETQEALGGITSSCWKFRGIISFNPLSLESEYLEYVHFTEGKAEAASVLPEHTAGWAHSLVVACSSSEFSQVSYVSPMQHKTDSP